ncbi:MAG: glycosyltransferase [Planctomycetota bacterium]
MQPPHDAPSTDAVPDLDVVAPAHNEADNLQPLIAEIHEALQPTGLSYHIIIVDDRSTDDTPRILAQLAAKDPTLRPVKITGAGHGTRGLGPSAALGVGFAAATAPIVASLDADRQNPPQNLPAMIQRLKDEQLDMLQGDRSANRRDNLKRRLSSKVGRWFRSTILGDDTPDSACALRVLTGRAAKAVPLQYKGMHRFIAPWLRKHGYAVANQPTDHRPRTAGVAKFGIWNRALPGLIDLFAVRWMFLRLRPLDAEPIPPASSSE